MTKNKTLRALFVSFEAAPFLKTGGLADVAGALPQALNRVGVDIRLMMPKYGNLDEKKFGMKEVRSGVRVPTRWGEHRVSVYEAKIPGTKIPAYFIDFPAFFHRKEIFGYKDDERRFAFFNRAVLSAMRSLDFIPDVLHTNDWQTGLLSLDLKREAQDDSSLKNVATLYTIHNIAYQGSTDYGVIRYSGLKKSDAKSIVQDLADGDIDMMFEGIANATVVSTVSPTYAKEILTKEYGYGMETILRARHKEGRLAGILNGIDTALFNPATDKALVRTYSSKTVVLGKEKNKSVLKKALKLSDEPLPLFGLVSRITSQKGFDILVPAIASLLKKHALQLVLLGTGEKKMEKQLSALAKKYPQHFSVILGFDNDLAKKIYAASDFFLMPSKFEPCGLSQMIAMRYGTPVVARKTGGLADTVIDIREKQGAGIVFTKYTTRDLARSLVRALDCYNNRAMYRAMQQRVLKQNFGWENSAKKYLALYKQAQKLHQKDLKK